MRNDDGFTIIEAIVTVAVGAIFLMTILMVTTTVTVFSAGTSRAYKADSLAYANMRTYANGRSPSWFTCPATQTDPVTLLTSTASVNGLPDPVQQTVIADAPYGCSGASAGSPIRVVSTVTYGPSSIQSRSATYATY